MHRLTPLLAVAVLLVLVPARDAHAYLDPGTGSLLIQMLVAGVLGALFTIKLWIGALKRFLRRLAGAEEKAATPADPAAGEDAKRAAEG